MIKPMIKNKSGSIVYISSSNDGTLEETHMSSKAAKCSSKVLSRELGMYKIRLMYSWFNRYIYDV